MSLADQYMGMFLAEMDEQLETISQSILDLEKFNQNKEIMNRLFRAAHTLKASSATMGFMMISDLTHAMENLFDEIRNGRLEVNLNLINIFFNCVDQLQTWHNALKAGTENLEAADEMVAIVENIVTGKIEKKEVASFEYFPDLILNPEVVEVSNMYVQKGQWVGAIGVKINQGCEMLGVRAYQVQSKAEQFCEIIIAEPEINELMNCEGHKDVVFWIAISNREEVEILRDAILNISEINEVVIVSWIPDTVTIKIPLVYEKPIDQENTTIPDNKPILAPSQNKVSEGNDYLRIEVGKLDVLMNLLGELVIDRARLTQIEFELENTYDNEAIGLLGDVSRHISTITTELQECLLKLRMSPMSTVYGRIPRIVRDLSHQLNKEVNLILEGEETELDRSVIQNIFEPLIHLIRNSLDHGLETPQVRIDSGKLPCGDLIVKAEQVGGEILITVKDDGGGINPEVIRQVAIDRGMVNLIEAKSAKDAEVLQWIFEPGFSTRKEANEVSGRGVGMDVVRHKVAEMQGRIQLESVVGLGTTISINLPLTLAVIRSLLVDVGGNAYTIPLVSVIETLRIAKSEVHQIGNSNSAIIVRGRTISLINLLEWCGVQEGEDDLDSYLSVVLVSTGNRQAGLIVNEFIGEQEIVIKPLHKYLGRLQGFAGATLLGDGKVALIIDILSLIKETNVFLKSS